MRRLTLIAAIACCSMLSAQNNPGRVQEQGGPVNPVFDKYTQPDVSFDVYFTTAGSKAAAPDEKGFIRRWALLEPIAKPEIRSNTIFTDSYLKEELNKEYFENQFTVVPKDGDQAVLSNNTTLKWHWVDSKRFNVKLYRFASGLKLRPTEALFLAVTVINAPKDMTVRLSAGSNSASMWWVNGSQVLLLSGDRRMVADDGVSKAITLKKGRNIVRGAIINGPGMSDFCVRFLDMDGKPVTNLKVSNK
ncbi:MAG: acetylxylan esterase [Bacteroidaceae bacterium]|nr:acetylxylan esterase [Bacteroidaceae bacterium]